MLTLAMTNPMATPNYGPWTPFARAFNVTPSDSGINVTAFKALQLSAVYACVKIIAETLGSLSCYTYEETENGKTEAEEHPVYDLLVKAPNPYMNAMTWVETMACHLLLFNGNAVNVIERETAYGDVVALWLIRPDRWRLEVVDGEVVYYITDGNGIEKPYAYQDILHIPGEGYDGLIGFNPISVHRELFGQALGQQSFGSALYRNGVRPSGVFKHPQKMKPEPFQRLKDQLQQHAADKGKALILEEGMDWTPLGMNMHDAQYVEQQRFSRTEIAAIYRVPPKMIGDTEAESYGSAEADEAYFVKHTLRPWAVRMEREFQRKLFDPEERYCVKFDFSDLLRGDAVARATANQILRRNGVINGNEWREAEDLNRLPGEIGETYIIEGNMTTMEQVGKPTANVPPPEPGEDPGDEDETGNGPDKPLYEETANNVAAAHREAFLSVLDRMAKIEATSRARAEKTKEAGACAKATEDHYRVLVAALGPTADAFAAHLCDALKIARDIQGVHMATKAAAFIAMQDQPTAEQCVDAVMQRIAEAVR